jgi:Fe-S oxidoreductase
MRYREDYGERIPIEPAFAYRREQGLLRALEGCSGVGVCRKANGIMCPSFQATREESDSTRGRANILRAAMTGSLPPETLLRPELHRVLDLCLECKGCKAECPTGVDMARIKAEYLALYQAEHGVPLRSRLFGEIARVQAATAPFAFLQNGLRRTRGFRRLQELLVGIDRRRSLPALSRRPFHAAVSILESAESTEGDRVVLFIDSFTDRNEPEVGEAARKVLQAANLTVGRARGQVCCGRPMISKGMLSEARQLARRNIDALAPYARAGLPIVGLEPSCLLTLRDEYLEFFPDDENARAVGGATRLLEELLVEVEEGKRGRQLRLHSSARRVLVHNHCHSRALIGSGPMLDVLRSTGAEVRETTAGCCGMAGSFGYEREHYDLSMQIAGMRLLPEVKAAIEEGAVVVAPGFSCRTQVRDGSGAAAIHPAVFLAASLGAG